jgi:ATP-dependent DNA helicase
MEEQQAAMRERAVKEAEKQKQQPTTEEAPTKATKAKVEPTRKSARSNAITVAPAATPAKGGKKRGRPAKGKTNNISDYFKKEDLGPSDKTMSEALADAANDGKDQKLGQQKLRPARQPRLITGGMMKEYQLEGLDWLVSLYENGLNGILADEMGLGKTLQTISFLAFLKEKGVWGPFLIACPVSTLHNWVSEINRFAPEMNVIHYHGTPPDTVEVHYH